MAVARVKELAVGIGQGGEDGKRKMLERCASTALNSKLISQHQDFFAPMVVDAISALDDMLDIKMVGVKKVPGGSVTDSFLVDGVAFKKTFSYAGFEQQQKVSSFCTQILVHISANIFRSYFPFVCRNSPTPKSLSSMSNWS